MLGHLWPRPMETLVLPKSSANGTRCSMRTRCRIWRLPIGWQRSNARLRRCRRGIGIAANRRRRARRSPFDCRRLSGLGWRCRVIQLRPGPLWPGLFHFNYVQVAAFGRLASGKQKVQVQALRRELDLGPTLYTPNVND
jgi:hypothetical protein